MERPSLFSGKPPREFSPDNACVVTKMKQAMLKEDPLENILQHDDSRARDSRREASLQQRTREHKRRS